MSAFFIRYPRRIPEKSVYAASGSGSSSPAGMNGRTVTAPGTPEFILTAALPMSATLPPTEE